MRDYGLSKIARLPLLMLEQVERRGMDRHALMSEAALDPEILDDPDSRIAMSSLLKLWQAISDREPGVPVGLLTGSAIKVRQLGVVGYAMFYSRDLLEAYRRLARYMRILSEAVQFSVKEGPETTALTFESHPALLATRHPAEAQVATVLAIGRELSQAELVPLEVHLPFRNPRDRSAYRGVFRCPVHFGSPDTALVCATREMHLPISASDPELSSYLDRLAGIIMDSLGDPQQDFVAKVRRTIWSQLANGDPNLANTASVLGTSARTLQRRLRDAGTSYSAVLEELRREVAGELLANRELSIADVAFLLGYSEPSAFRRTFRRWSGTSPRRFRARPMAK